MVSLKLKQWLKRVIQLNPTKANYKFIIQDWVALQDLDALSRVLETRRFSQNLRPVIMEAPQARKILFISPHPDDDTISSAGTLLHALEKGCKVQVIYLFSGSRQTYQKENPSYLSNDVVRREKEAQIIAARLGINIEFWRFDNETLSLHTETIQRLVNIYEKFQPQCIFLPFFADDNRDHRRSVELFYHAFQDRKLLNVEVWAYQVYSTVIPNVVVDITDRVEEKVELVNLWESQKRNRDWGHYIKGLNAFNCRFLKTNQPRYAETFFVVPAQEYLDLCGLYF